MLCLDYKCDHEYQTWKSMDVCKHCGLAKSPVRQDYNDKRSYSTFSTIQKMELGSYLNDLLSFLNTQSITTDINTDVYTIRNNRVYLKNEDNIRRTIMSMYDRVTIGSSMRNENKRALLAVCYFHTLDRERVYITLRDVCEKFDIRRKKYSDGRKFLLDNDPTYIDCDREKKVSSFVDTLFIKFNLSPNRHSEIVEKARLLDNYRCLINYNPFSICACLIFHILKTDISLKKIEFVKRIGISDTTFKKIKSILCSIL